MPLKKFTPLKFRCFPVFLALLGVGVATQERAAAQVLINESFTSATAFTPPTGWTNVSLNSTDPWDFSDNCGQLGSDFIAGSTAMSGNIALLSTSCTFDEQVAELTTPTFDAAITGGTVLLEFDNSIRNSVSQSCTIAVWNGTVWTNVFTVTGQDDGSYMANHKSIDITAATGGNAAAQVRFHYEGDQEYWWAIDNVKITKLSCTFPVATFTVTPDCTNSQYSISANITSLGSAASLSLSDGTTTYGSAITATGTYVAGPFANASSQGITLIHSGNTGCNLVADSIRYFCPPVNDECATPTTITPAAGSVITSPTQSYNASATGSAETLPFCASGVSDDVWFQFTATDTMHKVQLLSINPNGNAYYSLGMAVYSGTCGALTELDCEAYAYDYYDQLADLSPIELGSLTVGATYYVRVWTSDYATEQGVNFSIGVSTAIAPANDSAASAIAVAVGASCSGGGYSNEYASLGTGEPYASCNDASTGDHSVWFKFVAPASGGVKISTDMAVPGTLTDTKIGLFSATDSSDYTTFTLIACDDDNGVVGNGFASTIFTTDLVGGQTYYVEVDGYDDGTVGTFCLEVTEINPSMLSSAAACADLQTPLADNALYTGWITLLDEDGKLVANVRNPAGGAGEDYTGTYNVDGNGFGMPRQDGNGTYYLSRNYQIANSTITTPVAVRFYFHPGEIATLAGVTANATNLSNLNVTKQESNTCNPDFDETNGTTSVLTQTANGAVNGVSWIQVSTSSFSNFYLMGGTVPLPVLIETISAQNKGSVNQVNWRTATESRGDYFELERASDGKNFSFLARLNTNEKPSDYVYIDKAPLSGVNYYRLKLAGRDGKTAYSRTVEATYNPNGLSVSAYPNPTSKSITVKVQGSANGTVTLSDVAGRVVYESKMAGSEMELDMAKMANGLYLIRYTDGLINEVIKVNKQ